MEWTRIVMGKIHADKVIIAQIAHWLHPAGKGSSA